MTALGQLWAAGVEIDWERLYVGQRRRRVSLPTYPFERKRFWLTSKTGSDGCTRPAATAVTGETGTSPASVLPSVALPSGTPINPPSSDSGLGNGRTSAIPPATTHAGISRKEYLATQITSLLEELSGMNLEGVDASTGFLELGLDSLLLTQAANLFRRTFGVKVTFRQVMEDLSSGKSLQLPRRATSRRCLSAGSSAGSSVRHRSTVAAPTAVSAEPIGEHHRTAMLTAAWPTC